MKTRFTDWLNDMRETDYDDLWDMLHDMMMGYAPSDITEEEDSELVAFAEEMEKRIKKLMIRKMVDAL